MGGTRVHAEAAVLAFLNPIGDAAVQLVHGRVVRQRAARVLHVFGYFVEADGVSPLRRERQDGEEVGLVVLEAPSVLRLVREQRARPVLFSSGRGVLLMGYRRLGFRSALQ